jgi:hypothetical protein
MQFLNIHCTSFLSRLRSRIPGDGRGLVWLLQQPPHRHHLRGDRHWRCTFWNPRRWAPLWGFCCSNYRCKNVLRHVMVPQYVRIASACLYIAVDVCALRHVPEICPRDRISPRGTLLSCQDLVINSNQSLSLPLSSSIVFLEPFLISEHGISCTVGGELKCLYWEGGRGGGIVANFQHQETIYAREIHERLGQPCPLWVSCMFCWVGKT